MGEWRGCAGGEGFYFERLQPRMTGERLAGCLNALSDERALAALRRCGDVLLLAATGKTAYGVLGALRGRLSNDPGAELRVAAEEQAKITRLRLDKLVAS